MLPKQRSLPTDYKSEKAENKMKNNDTKKEFVFNIHNGILEISDLKIIICDINNIIITQKFSYKILVFYLFASLFFIMLAIFFAEPILILSVFFAITGPICLILAIIVIFLLNKTSRSYKNPYRLMIHTNTESICIFETPDIVLVNSTKRALEKALAEARENTAIFE